MEDQLIVVVKEHDSLTDVFKNPGFQGVQHPVGGVFKAAPVQQCGGEAIAADGVVQQTVHAHLRPEQEDAVDPHHGQNAQNHIGVLRPVFPWNPELLANQQPEHCGYHEIGIPQMQDMQGLHLIAESGDGGVSGDIVDGNLPEGIDGEHQQLKHCAGKQQPEQGFAGFGEAAFREINGKFQQAQQHEVDGDKIDAGHGGHQQIAAAENADEVADIHHRSPHTGQPQKTPGGRPFLKGFGRKDAVCQSNQNGDQLVSF